MPAVDDAWRALLEAQGLGEFVPAVAPLTRPAVRMTTAASDRVGVGASRIGGQPDLPADVAWPEFQGAPLSFIAQIALAEVPEGPARSLLPADGHLWFFYASDQSTWGFDSKDAGSARVLHRPDGTALAPTAPPDALPDEGRFEACEVTFVSFQDLPDLERHPEVESRLTQEQKERYWEIARQIGSGGADGRHKLLGHAEPVQNPMELECALVSHGLYCGDGSATPIHAPSSSEARRRAGVFFSRSIPTTGRT